MSLLFFPYKSYYTDTLTAFDQDQFFALEDCPLVSSDKLVVLKPQLRIFFAVPASSAKPELARVLFVFTKLFLLKPKVQKFDDTFYRLYADLSRPKLSRILGLLLRLKRISSSKFLHFFPAETSLTIVLDEPLTFFPLVHPHFDYHDWKYPFTLELSFSHSSNYAAYTAVNFFKVL